MPSKPSCSTTPSCLDLRTYLDSRACLDFRAYLDFLAEQTARATGPPPARLVVGLLKQPVRAGRHPGVEPPVCLNYSHLVAVPGESPALVVARQCVAADRANLALALL